MILDRAIVLFADQGFHAVTMDEIAGAAQVTKPILYDHFPSKEGLYLAVCEEIRSRLLSTGGERIGQAASFAARVRAGVEAFFRFAEENPAAIRILLSPPWDEKKLFAAIERIQEEATEAILQMVLAAGVQGPSNDAERQRLHVQVEFIKQGLHALGDWRTRHAEVDREAVVDAVSELIRAGLPRKPGGGERGD